MEPLDNAYTKDPTLNGRNVLTDRQRFSRGISSRIKGDKVDPNRLETGGLDVENPIISRFITMYATPTPSVNPEGTDVMFYHKSTGVDTKIYVLNSIGTEVELASSTSVSLDGSYNNGSTVAVDATDVDWQLNGHVFKITNNLGTTTYFQTSSTRTDIATLRINTAYTLPSADGSANQIIATNGVGALSFTSLATLGDGVYWRLDGANAASMSSDWLLPTTRQVQFRASTQYIYSANAGYMDLGASNGFRFAGALISAAKGIALTKSTATIATGAITYASGYMEIDTEAAAGADDLDTITAGIAIEGTELILKSTNNGRAVTVKHGTGNIRLSGGGDRLLDNVRDRLTLLYDGTDWVERGFVSNI